MAYLQQMPYLHLWQKMLAQTCGSAHAAEIAARAQNRYAELRARAPVVANRAQRVQLEQMILPGLAMYQVLREAAPVIASTFASLSVNHVVSDANPSAKQHLHRTHTCPGGRCQGVQVSPSSNNGIASSHPSTRSARSGSLLAMTLAEMEPLFAASFAPMRNLTCIFRYVPAPFTALRLALRLQLRGERPEDWAMVEESAACFAFDVRRCFIHDTLTAHGAPELTQLYCKMDDLLNEQLPPSIVWARTTTIGRGGARCDFRWERAVE